MHVKYAGCSCEIHPTEFELDCLVSDSEKEKLLIG